MSKHTPSEWKVSDDNEGDEYRRHLWVVATDNWYNPNKNDEPSLHVIIDAGTEADARLIAAAPTMLDALHIALAELTEDSNAQGRLEAAGWVQAAIDKAEGRS